MTNESTQQPLGADAKEHGLRQLQRITRLYAALLRCNRAIAQGGDLATVGAQVVRACVDAGHAHVASVAVVDGNHVKVLVSAGPTAELGLSTDFRTDDAAFADSASAEAIRSAKPQIVDDYLTDPRASAYADFARRTGVRGLGVFPLLRSGQVVGLLWLHVTQAHWFDEPLRELLTELAADLSFAIGNHEREQARADAEQRARAGHARFSHLFHSAPVPMMLRHFPDGPVVDMNDRAQRLLGVQRDTLQGQEIPRWLGADAESTQALLHRLKQDGQLMDERVRLRRADGDWRDVLLSAERLQFDDVGLLLMAAVDITERLRGEQRLAASERRLAAIVETAMDAIITVDRQELIRVFNRAAEQMFGLDKAQALGRPLSCLLPSVRVGPNGPLADGSTSDSGSPLELPVLRGDLWARRADGGEFPIEASISRVGEGEDSLITAMVRDLTTAHAAQRAHEAQIRAEAASRAKTEFIANLGHELRTPLGTMLGAVGMLQRESAMLPDDLQRPLRLLQVAGQHLLGLMDDLLDISRIDSGQLRVRLAPGRLWPLLQTAAELSLPQLSAAGLALQVGDEPTPAPWLQADSARLRQVLLNLLSNAAKYNRPDGWIRMAVFDDGPSVCVQVLDGGLGISADQQAKLFRRFDRLGREGGEAPGSGIGLALSRQLMQAMGGELDLHSQPDAGTTVSLRLPRAAPAVASESDSAGPTKLAGRVLHVDDDDFSSLLLQESLRLHPAVQVVTARSLAQGRQLATTQRFDLLLLDIHLPDGQGLALLEDLRREPATATLAVVVLSAGGTAEDEAAALRAGAQAWWHKPVDLASVPARLASWLGTSVAP